MTINNINELPEKWCLNCKWITITFSTWYEKNKTGLDSRIFKSYFHYPEAYKYHFYETKDERYIEISFDDFVKYVVNKEIGIVIEDNYDCVIKVLNKYNIK